jgi:cob(I)alamin adenosyltransferase
MKIYTRTGDLGETGLFAGPRVGKDIARIEAYGTVDELNAFLGLLRTVPLDDALQKTLERIQNELFEVGAELSTPNAAAHGTRTIGEPHLKTLEAEIDRYQADLPPLREFILPGGTTAAALLHVTRTVCRRAERRLVRLLREEGVEEVSLSLLAYLNRLGDLLFVLARAANAQAGVPDVPRKKPGK